VPEKNGVAVFFVMIAAMIFLPFFGLLSPD
jgi:hypothetical protein